MTPTPPGPHQVTALGGPLLRTLRLMVGASLTDEARAAFLAGLSEDQRALLGPGPPPEWAPLPHVIGVFQALEVQLQHRPRFLFGALLAELMGGTAPPASPADGLAELPGAYAQVARGGKLALVEQYPDRAEIWSWAVDPFPEFRRAFVVGFIQAMLERCGSRDIHVVCHPDASPGGDRYEVRWS